MIDYTIGDEVVLIEPWPSYEELNDIYVSEEDLFDIADVGKIVRSIEGGDIMVTGSEYYFRAKWFRKKRPTCNTEEIE